MYGGLRTPPYLGTPKHNAQFCVIYKAILHAKNSGHSGYFAKIDVSHGVCYSGYFAKIIQFVNRNNTNCISSSASRLLLTNFFAVDPVAAIRL